MVSTKGRLLVATTLLGDPNFERTVVLMLEHTEEGALGVVLNRPSPLPVDDPLPDWASFAPAPKVVFVGGPVAHGSVIALAGLVGGGPAPPEGTWDPVLGDLGVLDLGMDSGAAAGAVGSVRVFTGYAGWGPRQLDGEIAEGAWWVVGAHPADAMTEEPLLLWASVLRRQPAPLRYFSSYPEDPAAN